ncbi:hypothetical protein HYPSUDRAFT_46012 [Hypholoma sublateritium FD-334 SS-4]|uniref:Cupin type-2 domain-containing protein n=1 Tax=Hypholoma sublateritium (strain FD-334 SS-4) TaxID=945553 RepID=A0A0D2NMA5_HYPSF|nr:hypothetical protein HYPSUDRAFT_46012 [Hypholoma sublateritium FD-334 SS-4]
MTEYDSALPATIPVGQGVSMTFLRDHAHLSRVHIEKGVLEEFQVPAHWHEEHDELFRVIEGRLEVRLGPETKFCTAADGEICIPKGIVHSLRVVMGEECIFEERTDPMDDGKELFFRNALAGGKQVRHFFQAMLIMYHGDTRPALPLHSKWLEKTLVSVIGYYVAPFLGYKLAVPSLK